jgi:outer membrane cobalamin receptor
MRLYSFLAAILFGLALSQPSLTQAQKNATITGTLTDPSSSAISGATIAAHAIGSPTTPIETHSGTDGKFSLTLAPGRYRLTIEHESFARVEQEINLAPGEARTLDLRLELEPLSSSVVVTALAEPELLKNAVAPVDVITREDIDDRQQVWLTPVFASVPGASFSQLGPMGGSTTFFLDGGNSNYTKVLIDGVPVNQPGGLVDFSNFTLDSIDKIEVVHGASSALYGSDAMDGAIQIFTHRGSTRTPELSLEGDGGMFDTGHGAGQLSGLLGAFDYSLGAGYFSSQGQGPGDFFRDTTLSGNFGWKFSDTDSLRLALRNNSSDAGEPGQTLLPGESAIGQQDGLHDFSSDLNWTFTTGDHWHHEISGYESRYWNLYSTPQFGGYSTITEYNRAGLDAQSSYLFHNGGVTAGYMYEVENGPTEGRHNQAGYLEVDYRFGRRLTTTVGGRVEDNGFFGTRFVPRVGASYALRDGNAFWGATRLRASYGQGIKEPEILPADCSPQLAPEQSKTVDAGIDQYFASDRVRFSATFFHNDFRNIVSFAEVTTNPNCPAYGGSFFNTDKARAYGANSTIEIKTASWLRIIANYTYDDSQTLAGEGGFDDPSMLPGSRLFKRPLHSANLIANAHFRRMNWNLAGYYVGRRADSDFDSLIINGVCTPDPAIGNFCITSDPSYVKWDIANSINLGHGFNTVAVVDNLFNRHYSDAVGYPALRLNYRLGLKYTWGKD